MDGITTMTPKMPYTLIGYLNFFKATEGVLKENGEAVFSDETVAKEMQVRIHQAIESLPEQCRVIFKKSRFEEKKYGEIATELDLSIKTVEAQISKALKILREKLLVILAFINILFN